MSYLTYKLTPEKKCLDPNIILGIDMGVKMSVYMAVNNSYKRQWINGGEIESFRKKTESMQRSTFVGNIKLESLRKRRGYSGLASEKKKNTN